MKEMETPTICQVQLTPPEPVSYANLLKKLKISQTTVPNEQNNHDNQNNQNNHDNQDNHDKQNNQVVTIIEPKTRGFKKTFKFQNNSTKLNTPKLPKLSPEEYQRRLSNCKIVFMNELNKFLFEEIKSREKEEKEYKEGKEGKKLKELKSKITITNLERIQSGATSINIIRVISSRVEPAKLEYLENLIRNKEQGFLAKLEESMSKYDLKVSYKSLGTILIHSPYLMV